MKILVLSDWHLDAKDALGWFGWEEDAFLARLEEVVTHYQPDKIILNGDVFELYRYRKSDIAQAYPGIFRFFQRHSVIFIRGNHDSISHTGLDFYEIHHGERKILILHGHQADFLNGNSVMRALVSLGMKILRLLSYNEWVRQRYLDIYSRIDTKPLDYRRQNDFKYLFYAMKLLDRHYDAVIMGHTHQQEDIVFYHRGKKKYYLNSGTCTRGRFQAIIVDIENWEYILLNR
ncbi:metallophosphoesterase [Thermospira aquatica]|uniref:Metallophosphoesterase family protein n=1 Tax=Thermospira aquatica TaxID=2828656 RepID=A0AAX3BBW6_9SPIR|nr:metallophosphoesterase [Thermospira aquatica]URA09786.1 metallophosphoesterase family protein [Thermospira aquatica]